LIAAIRVYGLCTAARSELYTRHDTGENTERIQNGCLILDTAVGLLKSLGNGTENINLAVSRNVPRTKILFPVYRVLFFPRLRNGRFEN